MPDYGLVAAEELGPTTPQLAPLYPALPWAMPGVRIIKLAYEVGTDFIRHTLPAGLARSTPPYGTLLVYDVPESPFGPYRMAAQTLACRYRNFARVYVLQAVVDNPVALASLMIHFIALVAEAKNAGRAPQPASAPTRNGRKQVPAAV